MNHFLVQVRPAEPIGERSELVRFYSDLEVRVTATVQSRRSDRGPEGTFGDVSDVVAAPEGAIVDPAYDTGALVESRAESGRPPFRANDGAAVLTRLGDELRAAIGDGRIDERLRTELLEIDARIANAIVEDRLRMPEPVLPALVLPRRTETFFGRLDMAGRARVAVVDGEPGTPVRVEILARDGRRLHEILVDAPDVEAGGNEVVVEGDPQTIEDGAEPAEVEAAYAAAVSLPPIRHVQVQAIRLTVAGQFSVVGRPAFSFAGYSLVQVLLTEEEDAALQAMDTEAVERLFARGESERAAVASLVRRFTLRDASASLSSQGTFEIKALNPLRSAEGSDDGERRRRYVAWAWALIGRRVAFGRVALDDPSGVQNLALPLVADDAAVDGEVAGLNASETDLLSNPELYAGDPGSACRPFDKANRIVGERSFQTILRVEEPRLGALDSSRGADPRGEEVYLSQQKRTELNRVGINWHNPDPVRQPVSVAGGHVLEYRVRWRSNGYSLGDVSYSTTLAPRQTRHVTRLDWRRRERSASYESTQYSESLDQIQVFDRNFQASIAASLTEWSIGGSVAAQGGVSAGAGSMAKGVVFGGGTNAGAASSAAGQVGDRSVTASQQEHLIDALRQHADALRGIESTVVTETSQAETAEGVSEVIRNPNYCHSLTVIYYQILRHLRVDTEAVGVRECLFVPLATKPLNLRQIYRWRHVLRPLISDQRLAAAFDYIKTLQTATEVSSTPSEEALLSVRGEIVVRLKIERPMLDDESELSTKKGRKKHSGTLKKLWGTFTDLLDYGVDKVADIVYDEIDDDRDRRYTEKIAPGMARRFIDRLQFQVDGGNPSGLRADFTLIDGYKPGHSHRISFTLSAMDVGPKAFVVGTPASAVKLTFPLSKLQNFDIIPRDRLPENSIANVTSYRLVWRTKTHRGTISASNREDDLINHDGSIATFSHEEPLDEEYFIDPVASKMQDVRDLQEHINTHLYRYLKAIWWALDRDYLYTVLDRHYTTVQNAEGEVREISLASVCGRDPLGIVGNALVFPIATGNFLGFGGFSSSDELRENYLGDVEPSEPIRISLPTDGLYARALMDECNACEEHQGSTDWVLTDELKELIPFQQANLASRRAEPQGLDPTPVDTQINFGTMPAPRQSDFGAALSAVSAPAFNDITGLEGTQRMASDAARLASSQATQFGSMGLAAAMGQAHERAVQSLDLQQFPRKAAEIRRLMDAGLLDEESGKAALQRLVDGMSGGTPKPDRDAAGSRAGEIVGRTPSGSGVDYSYDDGTIRETVKVEPNEREAPEEAEDGTDGPASGTPAERGNGFDYTVPGIIMPLQQASPGTCWAAAMTMLRAWMTDDLAPDIEDYVTAFGDLAEREFRNDTGLSTGEKEAVVAAAGLEVLSEGASSMTPEGYRELLMEHGPIWLTIAIGDEGDVGAHANILYGLRRDASGSVTLKLVDPQSGQFFEEPYESFQTSYENLASEIPEDETLMIQMVVNAEKKPAITERGYGLRDYQIFSALEGMQKYKTHMLHSINDVRTNVVRIGAEEYKAWTKTEATETSPIRRWEEKDTLKDNTELRKALRERFIKYRDWNSDYRSWSAARKWIKMKPSAQDTVGYEWSAIFNSWVMYKAGADRIGFLPHGGHSRYASEALLNRLNRRYDKPFWFFRKDERSPEIGDIILKGRPNKSIDWRTAFFEPIPSGKTQVKLVSEKWIWGGREYGSHADIVIEKDETSEEINVNGTMTKVAFLNTIGGNTTDYLSDQSHTVGKKRYAINEKGFIVGEVDRNNVVRGAKSNTSWGILSWLREEDYDAWIQEELQAMMSFNNPAVRNTLFETFRDGASFSTATRIMIGDNLRSVIPSLKNEEELTKEQPRLHMRSHPAAPDFWIPDGSVTMPVTFDIE